jgi:hypothetical protein
MHDIAQTVYNGVLHSIVTSWASRLIDRWSASEETRTLGRATDEG